MRAREQGLIPAIDFRAHSYVFVKFSKTPCKEGKRYIKKCIRDVYRNYCTLF